MNNIIKFWKRYGVIISIIGVFVAIFFNNLVSAFFLIAYYFAMGDRLTKNWKYVIIGITVLNFFAYFL